MTDDQFDNWFTIETGMDASEWEFCRRDEEGHWLLDKLGSRYLWALRHRDWVVYYSVGLKPRMSPARHLGNDLPGNWAVVSRQDIPSRAVDHLVKLLKEGMKK